jgi:hypothetical protein
MVTNLTAGVICVVEKIGFFTSQPHIHWIPPWAFYDGVKAAGGVEHGVIITVIIIILIL